MPLISVILPVYNAMKYIDEAVQSVLAQTFRDFELLIVDNCSTDDTYEYMKSIKDPRVSIFRNEVNKGVFYSINFLITQSKAPLIKMWCHDDVLQSYALEEFYAFHQKHPEIGFSYCNVQLIDDNGKFIKPPKEDPTPEIIDRDTHARIAFYCGSIAGNVSNVMLNKAALNKVGPFTENMQMSGDFDMWVRIAQYYPIGFINKPLVKLRDHEGQASRKSKFIIDHIQQDIRVYKKLFSYIPDDLKKYGKKELRKYKLVYYFTLMVRAILRGEIKHAAGFWKTISLIDNPVIVFFYFLSSKLTGRNNTKVDLKFN